MSHKNSKQQWEQLLPKEKELLWLKTNGSRMVPDNLSGSDLDKLFKQTNYETKKTNSNSLGGGIPD
jgi:hypothetical protein